MVTWSSTERICNFIHIKPKTIPWSKFSEFIKPILPITGSIRTEPIWKNCICRPNIPSKWFVRICARLNKNILFYPLETWLISINTRNSLSYAYLLNRNPMHTILIQIINKSRHICKSNRINCKSFVVMHVVNV